jgi:hypothetical protein
MQNSHINSMAAAFLGNTHYVVLRAAINMTLETRK